jgi:hypothetical protein
MRQGKGEAKISGPTAPLNIEMEKILIEQLQVMEDFTKIPKAELLGIALKRFISQHKDYFPDDYGKKS